MLYAILGTSRMEEAMVKAIVGANWGDEGKGKITDMLAEESDIVVRFQGGSNAGHTIINDYGKFALHLLPSGVFYNHITSVIGNGVALNIPYLVKELKSLTDRNVPMPKILVSDRAQIMMPYHIDFDTYEEARLAGKSFGSTKSGIAPFYSDKYAKIGFQVSELFGDENTLLRNDYVNAEHNNIRSLVGIFPELFQNRKLFPTNQSIIAFANEVLQMKINPSKNRSKTEIIGEIVCTSYNLTSLELEKVVNALNKMVNNDKIVKSVNEMKNEATFSWNEIIQKLAE